MAIRASFAGFLSLLETLTGDYVLTSDNTVTLQLGTSSLTLDGSGTPPVTKGTIAGKAMVAGAGTIDLTALPGLTAEEVITGNGLKVVIALFRGKATNTGPITVVPGASNGYLLLGTAFKFAVQPGQVIPMYLLALAPTIDATHKNLDISGTGTEVLEYGVAMG